MSLPVVASPRAALPPSVNFHLWQPCNMRCRFCFATFHDVRLGLPKGHLPEEEALEVTRLLARSFRKITFAGGEPTLCPWLPSLLAAAHDAGAVTMVVTNGSRIDDDLLAQCAGTLDWLAVSIDSTRERTNCALGRAVNDRALSTGEYLALGERAGRFGLRLKVNTVVTTLNCDEEINALLCELAPARWKILRALPVDGQNDGRIEPLICSSAQFAAYVERARAVEAQGIPVVPEEHADIRGGYAMVDPAGRFFDNVDGRHHYGRPIREVGLHAAFEDVRFSMEGFLRRGGTYDFGGVR